MSRPSAFARGFSSLRREPAVLLAEIAWRWIFGAIAIALLSWATLGFLHSVEVSKADEFFLRSLNPTLINYALRDLFTGKGPVLVKLALIVSISLSLLWIALATIGRTATTRVLLERSAANYDDPRKAHSNFRVMALIHFLRVALLWIGLAAYVLSVFIASRLTTFHDQANPGAFLFFWFVMLLPAGTVLSFFNWILLLAPIYALRDGLSFADAFLAAARLSRQRAGGLVGVSLAHLAFRLIWVVFMSSIAFVPLGFAGVVPTFLAFGASFLLTLLYCAVADALFVARYASYIDLAGQQLHPEPALQPVPQPSPTLTSSYPIVNSQ